MRQSWLDLLFAHWAVDAARLGPMIPSRLRLDTWEGRAYVGVVPFRMAGIRLRGLPAVPGTAAFPELNVRTYVTLDDRPGVWFFSLDADNALAVAVARRWFHLPYFRAQMSCASVGDEVVYESRRTHRDAPAAEFAGRYAPLGPVQLARPGTLDYWLTERYCLYAARPDGHLYRGEIHHAPWPLRAARAAFERNTVAHAAGIALPDEPPLLHFADRLDVVCWAPERV